MKFKYVSTLALSMLMAAFASCSDNETTTTIETPTNPKEDLTDARPDDIIIRVEVPKTQGTRAESTTNIGIVPHIFDMTLIFVGQANANDSVRILKVVEGDVDALTGAGQRFKSFPLGVNGLYIIGNTKDNYTGTELSTIKAYNPSTNGNFGKLKIYGKTALADYNPVETPAGSGNYTYTSLYNFMKETRISLDNYQITDARAVNISGYAPILATQGSTPVRVLVTPAISRYEIREIRSKDPTIAFTLQGIYISNTMREISIDGQHYPEDKNDLLLNYGWNAPAWNYSLWNWDYDNWSGSKDPNHAASKNSTYYKYYTIGTTSRDATYAEHHSYKTKTNWDKWREGREKDLINAVTDKTSSDKPYAYRPSSTTPTNYWSYYIASARKQVTTNGNTQYVGLECGTWPYTDEKAYVESGDGLEQLSPFGGYNMANTGYSTTMNTPAGVVANTGIQYGPFPTICIHVTLDKANKDGLKEGWLTITRFLDAKDNSVLKHPIPGTVYQIQSVAFDPHKDLKPDPMWPTEDTQFFVLVTVKGWEGQPIEGGYYE